MRKGAWLPRNRRWKGNAGSIIEHGVAATRASRSRKRGTLSAFSFAAVPLVQNVLGVVGAAGATPSPYSKLEAITDPAKAGSELSSVEWVCRSVLLVTKDELQLPVQRGF
jgi:hypothetical protein